MIVGLAGHVDHGKTALVHALTGVDTDRLPEEKARGITLDLGFAYLPLPGGGTVGFVDVPGHERLVRTMIAGAAGIDFALLVVAADDGVMPQTREHIEILRLLGLSRGLVVVTKCDRVAPARAEAVAAAVTGMPFAAGDPAFVSARSGAGIAALRERLEREAAAPARAHGVGLFRLPVDRAFTLPGVGTVVTGTAMAGGVAVGDEVVLVPGSRRARVRSLHADNRPAGAGSGGERLALALSGSGIGRDAVGRGGWLCAAGCAGVADRFDADLTLLSCEARPLGDGAMVHLHLGASDVLARVVVLEGTQIAPGATALVQLVLASALPVRHGDRFVLRDGSARRTIGGGRALDPEPPLRRRRHPERLVRLAASRPAAPHEALNGLLALPPGIEDLAAFRRARGLAESAAEAAVAATASVPFGDAAAPFVARPETLLNIQERVRATLSAFHVANPDLPGITDEGLRATLDLGRAAFAAMRARLLAEKRIALRGHWLHLPGHVAELGAEDMRLATLIRPRLAVGRFHPPRVRDIGKAIGVDEAVVRRTCKALARSGELVEVAPDHFFARPTVVQMAEMARGLGQDGAAFSAADFRDKLDSGRKLAIQILEFFDRHGVTRRHGDLRRIAKAPDAAFGGAPAAVD